MYKKRTMIVAISALFLVFAITFVIIFLSITNSKNKNCGFFFWMDGYICLPVSTEFILPFTYIFENTAPDFPPESVVGINVKAEEENEITAELQSYSISDESKEYKSIIYNIAFVFDRKGEFEISTLDFICEDGTIYEYKVGNWNFIVGDLPSKDFPVIYSNIVQSSNSNEYAYLFDIDDATLVQIDYWEGKSLNNPNNSGVIPIEGSSAPVKVICPKLLLNIDGNKFTSYGSIFYGGILNITSKEIELSKSYMQN